MTNDFCRKIQTIATLAGVFTGVALNLHCSHLRSVGQQRKKQPWQASSTLLFHSTAFTAATCQWKCACRLQTIMADSRNVVPDVWDTLDKIKAFSEKVGCWDVCH